MKVDERMRTAVAVGKDIMVRGGCIVSSLSKKNNDREVSGDVLSLVPLVGIHNPTCPYLNRGIFKSS